MFFERRAVIDQPQAPRHAEVNDERARAAVDQQVFRAALERADGEAFDASRQRARNGRAHAPLAHDGALDAHAFHGGKQAAAGGFDFG